MPTSRLCKLCRGITAEGLASKDGYAHAPRPEDLGHRVRGSHCDLCPKLGSDYVPDYDPDSGEDPDVNSYFSKWDLRLSVIGRGTKRCYMHLKSKITPGPEKEWDQTVGGHFLLTPVGKWLE